MNSRLRRIVAAVVLIGALAGSSKGLTQKTTNSKSTKIITSTQTVDGGGRSF